MVTPEVQKHLDSFKSDVPIKSVVLFGIEAHVCVQQTALDLLEQGYDVHLVLDGISSQRAYDRTVAVNRIRQAGGILTTFESLVFELIRDSKDPKFKSILGVLKEERPKSEDYPGL